MELRQVRYFVRIAELESMTRAAEALFIAQPALSIQIRNLEEELGVQLLTRHSRGVKPTEAGERFLESARRILAEVDSAKASAANNALKPLEKVRLGINPSTNPELVARILNLVNEQSPTISLSLVEGSSEQICQSLVDGIIDLALVYFVPDHMNSIQIEPLHHESVVLISQLDKDTPESVALTEVVSMPLILQPHPHLLRRQMEHAAAQLSSSLMPVLEIASVAIILDLVERGFGSTILPASAAARSVAAGRLTARRIVQPTLGIDLAMAHVTGAHRTGGEIALAQLVRRAAREIALT